MRDGGDLHDRCAFAGLAARPQHAAMTALSTAQSAYAAALDRLETERLAALSTPGADPERLNIAMLRKMSAALNTLRIAQLAESH
jgi:hypothetical protein